MAEVLPIMYARRVIFSSWVMYGWRYGSGGATDLQ